VFKTWVVCGSLQKPDATNVAGLRTWNSLGRFVKREEKGIFILAPMIGKKRSEEEATVEEDKKSNGEFRLCGFRAVYVFDRLSRDLWPNLCALDGFRQWIYFSIAVRRTSSLNSSSCATLPDAGVPAIRILRSPIRGSERYRMVTTVRGSSSVPGMGSAELRPSNKPPSLV
jgi:hypothetical protein